MSNSYFNNSRTYTTGSLAKGSAVDDDFDAVAAGFDLIEADIDNLGDIATAVTEAEAAADLAEQWASEVEDTIVADGKYSALHHAAKAADSATEAATFDPANFYTKTQADAIHAWTVKTGAYTLVSEDKIYADTSSSAFTLTLPLAPSSGDFVNISVGDVGTNALTIDVNSETIEGTAGNMTVDNNNYTEFLMLFNGTTWKVFA